MRTLDEIKQDFADIENSHLGWLYEWQLRMILERKQKDIKQLLGMLETQNDNPVQSLVQPEVQRFAEGMQKELTANADKGSWKAWLEQADQMDVVYEVQSHLTKLMSAMLRGDYQAVKEHCHDIGNGAMFALWHAREHMTDGRAD